jgi:hypothetical protein
MPEKASKAERRRSRSQAGSSRDLRKASKLASVNPPVAEDGVVVDALLIGDSISLKDQA